MFLHVAKECISRDHVEDIDTQAAPLLRNNAAAPRRVGTLTGGHAPHRHALLVVAPLAVGAWDEPALGVPARNPGVAVVEAEKEELLGLVAFALDGVPAAALLHLGFEQIAVEDAAVDGRLRDLLVLVGVVATDEVPAAFGDVSVDAGNRRAPVFLHADRVVEALAPLEPVERAAEGAETQEGIGCHRVFVKNARFEFDPFSSNQACRGVGKEKKKKKKKKKCQWGIATHDSDEAIRKCGVQW